MPLKKTSRKKDFVWTDDELELLLKVTYKYKVRLVVEGIRWESVKIKYADILTLFQKNFQQAKTKLEI